MTIATIKAILWFSTIFLLVFSFPIQVMFFSPIPSLFPYFVIAVILALTSVCYVGRPTGLLSWNNNAPMNFLISVYLALVFFQTGWQTLFGFISIEQGISAIVIYVLPVVFFLYFKRVATHREIRVVLMAMACAGLGVGLYFVYDSYSMLVARELSDFSIMAHEYSQFRMGTDEANKARISVGYRSHGLLELHAVSAAWVALGCFAALTLIERKAIMRRAIIITAYGLILVVALNFTSIVAFAIVILFVEFRAFTLLRGRVSRRGIKVMSAGLGLAALVAAIVGVSFGDELFEVVQKSVTEQVELIKGAKTFRDGEYTYLEGLIIGLLSFPYNMLDFPPGILIGDGFSDGFGVIGKGGDYGVVETLHRLGLPFFFAVVVGLITLIRRALRKIKMSEGDSERSSRYLWFAVCVTIYLLFTEIHYSVWNAKSVLPVLFLALALYTRCLVSNSTELKNITAEAGVER